MGWPASAALYAWTVFVLVLWPVARGSYGNPPGTFYLLTPLASWGLAAIFAGSLLLLLSKAIRTERRIKAPILAHVLIFLGGSLSTGVHAIIVAGDWTERGRAETADAEFVHATATSIGVRRAVLGRVVQSNLLYSKIESLTEGSWGKGQPAVFMIRPADHTAEYGDVVVNDRGLVFAFMEHGECYLAYDYKNVVDLTQSGLTSLSPRSALSAGDQPNLDDQKRLKTATSSTSH